MTELERHLRRAESDLMHARTALNAAVKHAEGGDYEALQFVVDLVHGIERRIARLRQRQG